VDEHRRGLSDLGDVEELALLGGDDQGRGAGELAGLVVEEARAAVLLQVLATGVARLPRDLDVVVVEALGGLVALGRELRLGQAGAGRAVDLPGLGGLEVLLWCLV
jgi:hypothetical protein